MLRKVSSIREVLQASIVNSTVGQHLKNVAARAAAAGLISNSTEETRSGKAIIRQIADGIAFAGIFMNSYKFFLFLFVCLFVNSY